METIVIISLVLWAIIAHVVTWHLICTNTGARLTWCVCFSVFGFIASILIDIRNLLINYLTSDESDESTAGAIGFKTLDNEK